MYIEGIATSTDERDVKIELKYELSGNVIAEDCARATVVMINLGCAAYRALANPALSNMGHTGLITSFEGQCVRDDLISHDNYHMLEMQMSPENGFRPPTWTEFHNEAPDAYWGTFENSPSYVQRLKILKHVNFLKSTTLTYNLVDCIDYSPSPWDGSLQTITQLRCDGLVEVCMEKAGLNVWGRTEDGSTHYSIADYCSEHEEHLLFDGVIGGILFPERQCGRDPGPAIIPTAGTIPLPPTIIEFNSALQSINDEVAVPLNISPW